MPEPEPERDSRDPSTGNIVKPIELCRLGQVLDGVVVAERAIANARSSLTDLCGQTQAVLGTSNRPEAGHTPRKNAESSSSEEFEMSTHARKSAGGRRMSMKKSQEDEVAEEGMLKCPLTPRRHFPAWHQGSTPREPLESTDRFSPKLSGQVCHDELGSKCYHMAPRASRSVSLDAPIEQHVMRAPERRHHHIMDEIVVRSLKETDKELSTMTESQSMPRVIVHGEGHHQTLGSGGMMGSWRTLKTTNHAHHANRLEQMKNAIQLGTTSHAISHNISGSGTSTTNLSEGLTDKYRKVESVMMVDVFLNGWMRVPVVHPQAFSRLSWIVLSCFFITIEVFAIPYYIAFDVSPEGRMLIITYIINIYFLIDILVSFCTGYMDNNGTLVMAPRRIAHRYIFTWFLFDLLAAVPWDWTGDAIQEGQVVRAFRFARALRLLHLLRLVRMIKMKGFAERVQHAIEASQMSMFMVSVMWVLFLLFGVTHWAACIWYMIGSGSSQYKTHWLEQELKEYNIDPTSKGQVYIMSLYFTLTTMTTVGYGDITPTNFREIFFVLILLLVASLIFAGLMGVLTDLISSINSETHIKAQKKSMLTRYMIWRAVPPELTCAIREHLQFLWETNLYDALEKEIKDQLPPVLTEELCYHIYGHIIHSTPCFAWMKNYSACVKSLSSKALSSFFEEGDHLFRLGEDNDKIHILLAGTVWLTQNESFHAQTELTKHSSRQVGSTFVIPRNKQVGLVDVGLSVVEKARGVARKSKRDKQVQQDVLRILRGATHMDFLNGSSPRKRTRDMDGSGHTQIGRKEGVLKRASMRMSGFDYRIHRSAAKLQRNWRNLKRIKEEFSGKQKRKSLPKMQKVRTMHSTAVNAPTFFGESCLWSPIETWDSAPVYAYSARCTDRVEVVLILRESVLEVLKQYDPWLSDRLEVFQKFVQEELDEFAEARNDIQCEECVCGNGGHSLGTEALQSRPLTKSRNPSCSDGMAGRPTVSQRASRWELPLPRDDSVLGAGLETPS